MALTDTQKAQVRLYLGYSDRSSGLYSRLEGAMGDLSSDAETIAGELLTALASIDTKLTSSWDRQKVIKAEEVTLTGFDEVRALRSEGRRLVQRLSILLGVDVLRDAFSSSGSSTGITRRGA